MMSGGGSQEDDTCQMQSGCQGGSPASAERLQAPQGQSLLQPASAAVGPTTAPLLPLQIFCHTQRLLIRCSTRAGLLCCTSVTLQGWNCRHST